MGATIALALCGGLSAGAAEVDEVAGGTAVRNPHGANLAAAAVAAIAKSESLVPLEAASVPIEPGVQLLYPADQTLFPPDIVAPTFLWRPGSPTKGPWEVTVIDDTGRPFVRERTEHPSWLPERDLWNEIKRVSTGQNVEVRVRNLGSGSSEDSATESAATSATIRISTSTDVVGDALFYREVPLPFLKAVQDPSKIRWRYGTIDMEEGPPIVLENLPVCGNCHSFADNGSVLGLDVDYGNDNCGYGLLPVSSHMVMNDESIISWSDYERDDGELTFGLLSRVSPTGRYVISTVKDRSVFVARDELMISQLFFPIKGILVVHDRETGEFFALPGADDPRFVQTNPVWSPDGKEILFARTEAHPDDQLDRPKAALLDFSDVSEFTRDGDPFRYDLYRIPFNEGKGGTPLPVEGASANGMSNYFPKYSPDGKWIVFTQSRDYMLLRPDSELFIIPAAGGPARRLRYNTDRMNSWHSWSSNSRWLVFSSKQNGPYTQMWLTHIDAEGNDTPPVVLDRFTDDDRAANIPEFVNLPGDAIAEIREEFLDPYSFLRAGTANERTGDYAGAERAFRRGLGIAPEDADLRNSLGWTLFQTERTTEAIAEYRRALVADPKHARAHNNLALALLELGDLRQALGHLQTSVELEPRCEVYADLGLLQDRLGREDLARESYETAFALGDVCSEPRVNLGSMLLEDGEYEEAALHYQQAVAIKPTAKAYSGLGFSLDQLGRLDEASGAHRKAVQLDPDSGEAYANLALNHARKKELIEAVAAYRRAVALEPRVSTYYSLAGVLRALGRDQEAEAEYENARRLSAAQPAPPRRQES